MILKSETSDPAFNSFSRLNNAFGREVGFYSHCTPRLSNHKPSVYATNSVEPCWLLLEDLTHLKSGDQVIGLTYQETLATIERMARIHAEFWMDPVLHQHEWLPSHGFWFGTPDMDIVDDFLGVYEVRFGTEATRLYKVVLEQSEAINAAIAGRPWTLVHGDLRADNLLFSNGSEACESVIIDWSWTTCSLAAIDIGFLVGGSTPQMQRIGRHEDLLQAWHSQLLRHGVRDYSLSDARRDLQLSALRCMTTGMAMHGLVSGPETPLRVSLFVDDAVQRHTAYALELEAWEALPDPSRFTC
ncbi:MAG: phosphotransferase [Cyanobacteriota bacterium]|nr:phosphotransferase [Cyanobacteriota bacterium]